MLRHVNRAAADPAVVIGLESPDDAGVYRIAPDLAIVQTVDFFTPIVDDPYAWGQIAAANAMSDVYAMGARPVTAMNLVGWPRSLDFDLLGRVLQGGGTACEEAGVSIIGGHSVDDPEPKFGLAVTGVVDPGAVVTTTGAAPGDDLVLTKPLGTGIISTSIKEARASEEAVAAAVESMTTLNRGAAEAMLEVGAEAATDVTGFGLIGHLREMLGEDLSARLDFASIPVLPGAVELAQRGVLPGGSKRNIDSLSRFVDTGTLDSGKRAVLFDAQTSGGLLIAVDPARSSRLLAGLAQRGVTGGRIGSIHRGDGSIEVAD